MRTVTLTGLVLTSLASSIQAQSKPFRLVEMPAEALQAEEPGEPPEDFDLEASFRFLAANQTDDGRWASEKGRQDVAITSLCLLAYLGNGHTHRFGLQKVYVKKGIDWLLAQVKEGVFPSHEKAASPCLDQALATWTLAEAYSVTLDVSLKAPMEASCQALLDLQTESGGWSLGGASGVPNSLSTVFAILALKAVKTGGGEVPDEAFVRARELLAGLSDSDGLVGFAQPGDGVSLTLGRAQPAHALPLFTAGSLLSRIFTGERRSELGDGLQHLVPLDPRWPEPTYAFFSTYLTFQFGGETWDRYSRSMRWTLFGNVAREGDEAGSWAPAGFMGALGGRVGTTALNMQTWEIYARYQIMRERR